MPVARVSQSLTVWITAYDSLEISMHRTVVSLNYLIEKFIRALKTTDILHICIYGLCGQAMFRYFDALGYNFYLSEGMPCKFRLPLFLVASFQNICISLPIIQSFFTDKTQFYFTTGFSFYIESAPSGYSFR